MAKHTTLGIGGAAKYFTEVETCEQLVSLLKFINKNKIPFYVIGGGSNVLFSDDGFDGIVMKLSASSQSDFGKVDKPFIHSPLHSFTLSAGAAVNLSSLAKQTAERSLSGLEHFAGIPGTVGGAVFGNAGVKNNSISDSLKGIEIADYSGNKKILTKENINFEYRKSGLNNCIITKAIFILKKANKNDILKTISQELEKRKNSQPTGTKNAGCVFKNPAKDTAGRLIDSLNLKNYNIGEIVISNIHANFFINRNNGTAKDMISLIEFVKNEVYKKYDIKLETEIKIIK